ncbi:MAG: FHA domain-containing protein [Planctomycetes bacterium]|nr:FHA domain-containing protein [Planctomycetota bacterium]
MANYVLEILDGDRAGEVLPVGDAVLRIGRKAGNDLVLADEKTSGVHCEIAPEGDRLVLKDLGSTNGTFLDGKRVTELVLTPGDVITVGRLRVKFRSDGDDAAVGGDGEEFSLRKLDAARLQKRGSPIGLLLILLVVLGGGGGYWWWMQQEDQAAAGGATAQRRRDPLQVAGNRLDQALAACESDEGWELGAAGLGFRAGGEAHTGDSGFTAYRGEDGGEEGEAATPQSEDDFAILRLGEPVQVFAGRTLTVAAHCRTVGDALVGVRAVAFAAAEDAPFRFVSGCQLGSHADWQRLETVVTVPAGCDRLQLEVVAVLPADDAEAQVDDIAITDGGDANGVELKLESGQTALGFGSAVAVRSADPANPATVLAVVPNDVPAPLRRLHEAGLCVLSDLGASLAAAKVEHGFTFEVTGASGLQFVLPADAGAGLLAAPADGAFASAAAESELSAARVVFGSFGTRGMLRFDEAVAVRGAVGGGVYRLAAATPKATVVVGFRSERQQAGSYVRQARSALADGRPGAALDTLDKVFTQVPMDSKELASARELRTQILADQAAAMRRLQRDLEASDFFDTRGGFERVREGVDALVALYGEHHVEDLAAARELRGKAEQRLQAFDRTTYQAQRERLTDLADAFGAAEQAGLQKMVRDYIERHLPASSEGDGTGGTSDGRD